MPKTKTTRRRASESRKQPSVFEELFNQIVGTFIKNFADRAQEAIRIRVNEIVAEIKKGVSIAFLLVLGVGFVFFGIAGILDQAIGVKGVGYLMMGCILMVIGLYLNMLMNKQK